MKNELLLSALKDHSRFCVCVCVSQKLSLQLIIIYPSIPIDDFINKIND